MTISLEYLAGLVDADGCLGIVKNQPSKKWRTVNPTYKTSMNVSNTCLPVLEELKEQFGGFITAMKVKSDKHNVCYQWVLGGRSLEPLLTELASHLRIKGQQANMILAMRSLVQPSQGQGVATDKSIVEIREMLYQANRRLNSGGKGSKGKS